MPAVRLLEARLEASDVGALIREAHPRGGGLVGGSQVGVPKGRPALRGPQLRGVAVVCRVEECAELLKNPGVSVASFSLRTAQEEEH